MNTNDPKSCNAPCAPCAACDDPTDMNWRRAIGLMENHFIERGHLGTYEEKLALVKAVAGAASA